MKRIVICADGTWNRPEKDPEDQPTNVLKLARAVKPLASDGIGQQVFYKTPAPPGFSLFCCFSGGRGISSGP